MSRSLLLGAIALTLAACGGEGGGLTFPPTTGTLQVTASTRGDEMDPDGFSVKLDAQDPDNLAPGGMLERAGLQPGDHTVFLGGVAANCSVADNPQTVTIKAGETATVQFAVTCTATSGSIVVTTTTTGDSPDPDGYSVILDGSDQGAITTTGQLTLTGLVLGSHVVGLTGLAGNCQVQGDNLRTVTVTPGGTATADYTISCTAPPPGAGTLRISTTTTGNDPDAGGYTVSVDGGPTRPIGPNAVEAISNVAPGNHQVRLSDVSSNCRVQGANPRAATVPAGGSVDVGFSITCTPATGTVRVNLSTHGQPTDPNGYVATLDGTGAGKNVGVNGSVRFDDVPVGSHTIGLGDIASNCSADAPSKTVSVTAGTTSDVSFTVTCSATTGSITVTTQTNGSSPDLDGYTIRIDGTDHGAIGSNDQQTVNGISAGSHTVTLSGVAGNCTIDGDDQRTVNLSDGGTATVGFTVTCSAPAPDTGALHITTSTTGADQDADGYSFTIDQGAPQNIDASGQATVGNLSAGKHTVQLSGIADNCTVQGDNPRSVTVSADGTTEVPFDVSCTATSGAIEVTVSTSGDQPDQNGYDVTLDGTSTQHVAVTGSVTFTQVPPGTRTLVLGDVAENCTVTGGNSQSVTVTASQTSKITFSVSCPTPPPQTGSINVTTSTTGDDPDADGYTVTVDGAANQHVDASGSTTFDNVPLGDHAVELSGLASDCTVNGDNPVQVSVTGDSPGDASFSITCTAQPATSASTR
jgi:hypothetical protein